MAGPCNVTPLKGLAKVLGLQEGKQISYAEWVDAFRKGVEKGDIKLDKNGNIEFGEKAETTIRQANLLSDFRSHLGLDKKSDIYTMDSVDEIDKSGFSKLQVKVLEDVKRVMGAVNNLVKNVTGKELSVNVHRSEEQYKKALMELGEPEEAAMSKGVYISEDGVIHLNMNRVSSETFLHEAFHPVLDYLAANNPKLIDSLYKQLRGIEGGQDFTKKSAKSYKGGGALTIKKEAITDFIAHVADGTFELTKTNYEKVKNFIKDLLKKMGIKIPEKYSDIRDIEDLKDLAEFVSQSFKTGKEIESFEVDKSKLGAEGKAKQMMSFSKTNYGESGIAKDPALDNEEYDRALTDRIMPDGTPRIQIVDPRESLKDKKMMQTFPDDHFVGSIKYKDREVAYGNGGIFYVAKYGENGGVWSSVSKITADSFAKNINKSREINGGEGIVLLTKGDDLKHQTSLESVTGLLSTLLTAAEIEGKESYDSIVNVVKQLYDIHGNTKNSQAVKKYFDEYLTGGRAESGQTMKNAKKHFETMMTKLTTQSNAAVTNILKNMGFDGERYFDKTGLKKGKYKVTNKGLKNFFIDVFAEDALSGVQAGEVYGAIKVYSDVKTAPKDNSHPSYPYPIVTVDGSPVKLEIFDRTFRAYGDNVALKGRQSESKAAYGTASFTTPIYTIDPSKISDVPTRTEKIEQYESVKRTQKPITEKPEGKKKGTQYSKDQKEEVTLPDGRTVETKPLDVKVVNGFYSPIEKNLMDYGKDKIKAKDWLNVVGKGDEAVFTGVRAFLEGKDPNAMVSKQEILDYMKDNRISVSEVVLKEGEGKTAKERFGKNIELEGEKENYKEVLVTLPREKITDLPEGFKIKKTKRGYEGEFPDGAFTEEKATEQEVRDWAIKWYNSNYREAKEATSKFQSSHFDEPNILVHLRMNTRTDSDGNKVLFLEEVQSDWGQTGKKEGFKSADKDAELKKLQEEARMATFDFNQIEEELDRQYEEKKRDGESRSELRKRDSDFNKLAQQYIPAEQRMLEARRAFDLFQVENRSEVPTAPFVMDTNAWTKLGLKVALKEAVKQGADKIAWTTGEQQNDRYDLSKQVDEIIYTKNNDNTFDLYATKNGQTVSQNFNKTIKEIESIAGKDIADKILNEEGVDVKGTTNKSLKGDNLKVGGKGMIAFYGSIEEGTKGIVGGVAEKVFGQKVGETKIEGNKQPSIEVTPQLKTEVKRGLPQFSKVENDKVADTYYEPHMTESEDGKDYVFFHVSNADPKSLEKGIDSRRINTLSTSREEKATQYGVASFYTKPEDTESMVRGNKYVVRVPKDKVYPMDTDPNEYRERAEAMIAKDAPFRAAAVKKRMAEMAASDGYQMAVGEWRFDRKGQKVSENEFRADALVPLKPTKESPQSYASNIAKGMERIPHPNQENYLRADKLNDLAEKIKAYYSSKSKYGEAYQMASSIVTYGGIMENLNQPNERVRPVTKEDFDIMTKDLPPELKSVANTLQFSKGEEETNDMMKDWVASQFKAGIGGSDLIEVLKQYGLEDKKAKDIVAAAVESLNEPTKAQKNKQRADAVNPFINYTPDETGVQNMVATLERIQQGKEPIEISASDKRDWKETMRRANEFFLNPNNNVEDLVYRLKNGAAPTAEDVAVMSMHKVDLDRQMAEALERRARLVAEGNPEFLKEDAKIADISSRLEDYYEAARRSAYEQGLAFNIRKMMLANDYSIGTVLRRIKATGDAVIPTKVMEQIETLTSQLKQNTERILELEDQLQKERAQATLDAIKNTQAAKTEEKAKSPAKTRVEKAVSAIQSIRAKINISSYFGGEKPAGKKGDFQYSKEEADDAATAFEKGLAVIERSLKAGLSVSRAIEKGVKSINKSMKGVKWDEEKFRKDVSEGFISEGVDIDKTEISDLEVKDGKLNITRGYLESLVENGYDTIDQMVDYIKETEAGEKFTEREIMDAISGYGEVEYPPQDKISEKISIAKGEGKSLSALADVVKGMLPKRSGFQRREKTDRERTLLKEIRQRLKAFPEDAEKSAKSWASALDRIKSSYKNRIADLQKAIDDNKKIFREKRETQLDDEARSLKEQKKAMQAAYDAKFPAEIKSSIEKLVDRVNEYTKKINEAKKNNDPEAERKAQIEKDLTEGVITDLKAAVRANRTEQEKKLDELKSRLKKQIEQLNKKIDGTYEEKAKIDFTLDNEAIGLTQEVEQLKGLLEGMTGSKTESDAEKAERLVNYYEKQVAQLEADIEAMNIGYKVRSTFAPTPEMQKVKDKLDDLREMRQMLREQLGLAYERDVKLAEKRNERAIKELEQKRQAIINGTYKPKLKKPTPTSNLIEIQKKTKAAISNQIEQIIADRERANRSKFQKVVDSVSEVFRASVLSGIATLEKLMGYGIMESHITQPLGGLVVGQVTRAIPYINRINRMAGGRMTLTPREEAKKVAKGIATFWSKDTWADTKQVAKTGKSELDLLWGEFKVTHPEIGAWVGHMHKALKNPTVRASFVRHMEGNLIYFSETMKMSVSDPAVVEMASRTSLLDAYSDILLNKNYFSSQWNALVRNAELMGKGKNVYLQNTGIALAGFLKVIEPVTGVPVNAANRLMSYYPPIGAARAVLGILSNAVKGIKPEEMTKEDASEIIRNIKSAGVGAIGYAIGYIFADLFGGSDDDEKFRNEMGLKKGEFAFMPKAMGHHPLWEVMQIGATDRRMDDKGEGDAANKFNNYKKLQWEYVENTPFFDLPLTVEEAMTEKGGFSRVVGGLARNMTTPMLVQQLSKFMDTDSEGNPINRSRDGFLDELASGIYPFRTNLPVKGGFMLKERDKKYLEDIYFVPKMAKKTDDKFTLKGKEVITDDEYKTYTNNVNREFNEFLSENIDALRYRGYSQEEEDEINKDLVEPMTIVEASKSLEKKKKDMMSRAKAAIERKQTLEYQYNKNMITPEVYDREIKSAETELKNISNWINEIKE